MSDDQPTEPTVPLTPTGEIETVGPELATPGRRRGAVVAAVAVVVVAVLGGGAYAAYSFLAGGGPQPADVLPATTVAVVSVDLDPSAGQKIAAIKSIQRFPALKKSLGLKADDDLRQYVFDKVVGAGHCHLDFDKDVKPWLGKRAAFAGVDLGGAHPAPVIALQISDPEKAKAGFRAIVGCTDPKDFAYVVGDDYLIASDSAAHAQSVLDLGRTNPLADDTAYRKWTDEVGDAGVLNFYVSKRAAHYGEQLLDEFSNGFSESLLGGTNDNGDQSFADENFAGTDPLASAKDALKDFDGLAGTVRFAGGGMELSVAGGGVSQLSDLATVGKDFGELPADTAVALGIGIPDDYAKKTLEQMGSGGDDFVTEAEKQAGLTLPEDLQTLLGRSVIASLGGDAPGSLDDIKSPDDVPAGVLIHGDADKIKQIIATAEDHLDMHLSDIPLVVEGSDDKVAIATSSSYADDLLKSGGLGSQSRFRDAVPDSDRAAGILFVDFDSPWGDTVADMVGSDESQSAGDEVRHNIAPLRALGFNTWEDGDVSHALLKITTN
ncbi:MAG: DUF3352 domain-containing protein [Propionibacteriales bacterium]|nr:DUF3352 domain-containing protein [Propionibacteriales bacterium]